jgi:SAM-dependent methyltransferase
MPPRTNKDVFSTEATVAVWASRDELGPTESFLIERYLDKGRSTLEAGTGAGRILRAMLEMGYGSLTGFDYVPAMITAAQANDRTGTIRFDVQDATRLDYADGAFGQVVYLQQVICFIEDPAERTRAMQEAFRVLDDDGVAVFSFLSWEARLTDPKYRMLMRLLQIQRRVRRSRIDIQDQPLLRLGKGWNARALVDQKPHVHWYTMDEAQAQLGDAGFSILAAGFFGAIPPDQPGHGLVASGGGHAIYVVCRKPSS